MGFSLFIIAICLIVGGVAAILSVRPNIAAEVTASLRKTETVRRFTPKNTLFIVGPAANHQACRMQRRLLKPAIPALIRDDVVVMELYGDDTPRKNGEPLDWLDPALLRHAIAAGAGFNIIYVDPDGKTQFRSEAPMLTADILRQARIDTVVSNAAAPRAGKSKVLKKLRAA